MTSTEERLGFEDSNTGREKPSSSATKYIYTWMIPTIIILIIAIVCIRYVRRTKRGQTTKDDHTPRHVQPQDAPELFKNDDINKIEHIKFGEIVHSTSKIKTGNKTTIHEDHEIQLEGLDRGITADADDLEDEEIERIRNVVVTPNGAENANFAFGEQPESEDSSDNESMYSHNIKMEHQKTTDTCTPVDTDRE